MSQALFHRFTLMLSEQIHVGDGIPLFRGVRHALMMLAGSRCARSLAVLVFALVAGAGDCIADELDDLADRSKFFASAQDRAEPGRRCCQVGKISEREGHESPALQTWRLVRTPSPTGG